MVKWLALLCALGVGLVASGQGHTDLVMHCKVDWCGPTDIASFDEPPTEWATYEWRYETYRYLAGFELIALPHFGCADLKRVLLTSEDGAKHCYLFSQAPR